MCASDPSTALQPHLLVPVLSQLPYISSWSVAALAILFSWIIPWLAPSSPSFPSSFSLMSPLKKAFPIHLTYCLIIYSLSTLIYLIIVRRLHWIRSYSRTDTLLSCSLL